MLSNIKKLIQERVESQEAENIIIESESESYFEDAVIYLLEENETSPKKDDTFKFFGKEFKIPKTFKRCTTGNKKIDNEDSIKDKARDKIVKVLNDDKKIKKMEKRLITLIKSDSKDDLKSIEEKVYKYIKKCSIGDMLFTPKGEAALEIKVPDVEELGNFYEHGLYLTTKGNVETFDEVEMMESYYDELDDYYMYYSEDEDITNTEIPQGNSQDDMSIMDTPISGNQEEDTPTEDKSMDMMNTEINTTNNILDEPISGDDEQQLSLDGDDLPEPVGAQTGEPINDDNDIFSTEIDLSSNTPRDILPIPPTRAIDSLAGDDEMSMNQRVPSGYSNNDDSVVDMNMDSQELEVDQESEDVEGSEEMSMESFSYDYLYDEFFESSNEDEDIINLINGLSKLKKECHTTDKQIKEAEDKLGVEFAKDYRSYVKEFGVISADGVEITGICKSKRLNVVDATLENRKRCEGTEKMYLVENVAIDGILMWQDSKGKIYETRPNVKPKKCYDGLADYIKELIKEKRESAINNLSNSIRSLLEAITIGDDNSGATPTNDTSQDQNSDAPDSTMAAGKEENNVVTNAVKDKVNEAETQVDSNTSTQDSLSQDVSIDDGQDVDMGSDVSSEDGGGMNKEKVAKRLSKLQKDISDTLTGLVSSNQ